MKLTKNAAIYITWFILAFAAICVYFAPRVTPVLLKKHLGYFPFEIGGWKGVEKPASDYMAAALGADYILVREYYGASGEKLEVYMSYFAYTKEKKTPHAPQLCWVGSGWALKDLGEETLALESEKCPSAAVRKILAEKDGERILLIYTYKINERYETDLLNFRIWNVLDSIFKRKNSAFTIQVSSQVGGQDFDKKEARMKDFLSKVLSAAENDFLP